VTQDRASACVCASLSLVGQPTPIRPSTSPAASSTQDHWLPVSVLSCGSIWRYGASRKLPIAEGSDCAEAPFDEYGIEKERIAFVGPGWFPIGPLGNFDPTMWTTLAAGEPLKVPFSGAEMMHHVHADDVAQAFELAVEHRDAAAGEDFNILAPTALSVRGYAAIAAGWFGQTAKVESVTWEEYRELTTPEYADASWGICIAATASPSTRPRASSDMRRHTSPRKQSSSRSGGSPSTHSLRSRPRQHREPVPFRSLLISVRPRSCSRRSRRARPNESRCRC
jgi:hypothetical protein